MMCDLVLCVCSQEYHGRTSDDNSSNSHAVSFVIPCFICLFMCMFKSAMDSFCFDGFYSILIG